MSCILRHIAIVLALILSGYLEGEAQTRKFFSPDNGLSNSLVNKVYQDRRGFIWVATEYGLNKFDGLRFTIYRDVVCDEKNPVIHNYFKALFEDKAGNFLVGTINGLLRYDEATDSFEELSMIREGKRVYPHVTAIIQRTRGDIWLTTSGQGVFSAAVGEREFHYESLVSESLSGVFLNSIYEDSRSNIWIGSENDGLNFYSTKGVTTIFRYPEIGSSIISDIDEDVDGNIYVGTLTQGVYRYNWEEGKFYHVQHRDGMQLYVKSLKSDKRGRLYIGTDGQGLMVYNPKTKLIETYEINATPFDFTKGKVHTILLDRNRNLWLGFYQKGLIFIPTTQSRFEYYGYRSLTNNPIGSCSVTAIHGDKYGGLWIGTDNDGIYGLNFRGQRVAHYFRTSSAHSAPDVVHSIYEDEGGSLWLGSYISGLSKLNPKTGYCEYIPSFADVKVFSVTSDRNGNIIVGSFGAGFFILDKTGKELSHYESSKKETNIPTEDELPNDWINYLICDRDGFIWIGHYQGLSCFDPVKKTFLTYSGKNNLMPGLVIKTLMEDRDGNIWIGSSSGLYCFNKKTETMTAYSTADGLANDVICGICEDNEYNIWISTFDGISNFKRAEQRFINYYADDGLQGNEFSRGAMYRDRFGKIYFGGTNGVSGFYSAEIVEGRGELNVMLTNFYVGNRLIRKGDLSGKQQIIQTSVIDADEFTLSHNDNTFSIELSTLDFMHPERISYQYMMEGLNREWTTTAPGSGRITYNNLDYGEYMFHVKAVGDNNRYSQVKTIRIIIRPAWYKTWPAYLMYWLLVIGIAYGIASFLISRMRYKDKLREKENAEKITEAKLQFLVNISHEVRTPLTLIINPLEKLIGENDETHRPAYLTIYRNAQRILRLVNQMMDVRKLDEGGIKLRYTETDMVAFIEDIMRTFEYQATKKDITFTFYHTMDSVMAWIDVKHFDKVVMNMLSNAFKFTPDSGTVVVELSVSTGTDYLEISVSDTGSGIDEDKIEKVFERFYQIENEQNRLLSGTGLGLHLSRSLAELHHGVMFAENRDTGGSRFVVRLPLGKAHLHPEEIAGETDTVQQPPAIEIETVESFNRPVARAKTKYRILVVDDEEEILNYLNTELSTEYHIKLATNGKDALEYILKSKPDLVVSDVMMPLIDGITLSRKIKQNINISHIPVILLTAKTGDEDMIKGLEKGADAYIIKPFNTDVLRQTISNLLATNERLMNKYSGREIPQENISAVEVKSYDEQMLEKVMTFIHQNISNKKLNNEMIAQYVGISRVHLFRKIKEMTNQSPGEFIRNVRLNQATLLLKNRRMTISEVAYATGFSSLSQFSASFHSQYGVSPSEYSQENRVDTGALSETYN